MSKEKYWKGYTDGQREYDSEKKEDWTSLPGRIIESVNDAVFGNTKDDDPAYKEGFKAGYEDAKKK